MVSSKSKVAESTKELANLQKDMEALTMQANVRQSNMMSQAPVDNFYNNPPPAK